KAEALRSRGENPFANDVTSGEPLLDLASARALFEGARGEDGRYDAAGVLPKLLRVAGRVLFLRAFGGITFIRLRDRTGEIQLYCEEASLGEGYGRLDEIDLGDIVE